LNSGHLKSRLRLTARRRKSSTSWLLWNRVCRQRDEQRSGMLCEREWANLWKRKWQGRERQGPDQARAGPRI